MSRPANPHALALMKGTEPATRGRMFTFHKTLSAQSEWRLWERELWKLTRIDPPERQLWAVVLALALADIYRGSSKRGLKLRREALRWLNETPLREDEPLWNRVGAFQWVCNELGLCAVTIRRDVLGDVQAGRVRLQGKHLA